MTDYKKIAGKVDYVRDQAKKPHRNHTCHWPGCKTQVAPALWGCFKHWKQLPADLRSKVWRTFQPGQEINGTPSDAYLKVAQEIQQWIAEREASKARVRK